MTHKSDGMFCDVLVREYRWVMNLTCPPHEKTPAEAVAHYRDWLGAMLEQDGHLGPPKRTGVRIAKQLEAMGVRGLYLPEKGARETP